MSTPRIGISQRNLARANRKINDERFVSLARHCVDNDISAWEAVGEGLIDESERTTLYRRILDEKSRREKRARDESVELVESPAKRAERLAKEAADDADGRMVCFEHTFDLLTNLDSHF